jgi:DNA-directed RNA polymerase specialized sigma24 family protein
MVASKTSLDNRALVSELRTRLRALDAEARKILYLRFWENFTIAEIARALGKSGIT